MNPYEEGARTIRAIVWDIVEAAGKEDCLEVVLLSEEAIHVLNACEIDSKTADGPAQYHREVPDPGYTMKDNSWWHDDASEDA